MIPYLQTTPFTTAASSLLTILHHLNPEIKLTKENEFQIWQKTSLLPTRASSIYALANYAQKQGLKLKVVVEKKEYDFPDYRFYRYTKAEIEQAAFSSNLYFQKAQDNVLIEEKVITFNDVKNELKNNHLLLLRINAKPIRDEKRNTSNYVVVYAYINNSFKIIDPNQGALSVPENIFREAFESLESKKYRANRMIIFEKKEEKLPSLQE